MTIIRGFRIVASPCCGAQYSFPRYVSMNFMAFEYWTDGWRDGSLMPNDEGLRRCKCGQYILVRDMVAIDTADSSELPYMDHVPDELLPECIAKATSKEVEVAARLGYWRYLNHPYRDRYRQHRDAEEAVTKAAWEAANPDRRNWWGKLRGRQAPSYSRPPGSPFTYPAFEASEEQLQNMQSLSEILREWVAASRQGWPWQACSVSAAGPVKPLPARPSPLPVIYWATFLPDSSCLTRQRLSSLSCSAPTGGAG